MGLSILSKIAVAIMSLLRVGLSIAIIIITAGQLYHIKWSIMKDGEFFYNAHECLMAGSVGGGSVCGYTFAVCGLSLLLSLITSILLCITCELCGGGAWVSMLVEGFQTAWWVIAGIVVSTKVNDSNDLVLPGGGKLPHTKWRNAVAVMTWGAALMSMLILFAHLKESVSAFQSCWRCCCGCCYYEGEQQGQGGAEEGGGGRWKPREKDEARRVDYLLHYPAGEGAAAAAAAGGGQQPQRPGTATRAGEGVRANAV